MKLWGIEFKTNSIDWWTMKVEHAINLIDERGIYVSRNFDFYIYGLVKWQCELNFSFYKYIPISTYLVLRIVFAIPWLWECYYLITMLLKVNLSVLVSEP